jgi:hypothetical protein
LTVVLEDAYTRFECGLQEPMIVKFPRGGYFRKELRVVGDRQVDDVEEEVSQINCDLGVDDGRIAGNRRF